jgi:hypothetical protein
MGRYRLGWDGIMRVSKFATRTVSQILRVPKTGRKPAREEGRFNIRNPNRQGDHTSWPSIACLSSSAATLPIESLFLPTKGTGRLRNLAQYARSY